MMHQLGCEHPVEVGRSAADPLDATDDGMPHHPHKRERDAVEEKSDPDCVHSHNFATPADASALTWRKFGPGRYPREAVEGTRRRPAQIAWARYKCRCRTPAVVVILSSEGTRGSHRFGDLTAEGAARPLPSRNRATWGARGALYPKPSSCGAESPA